MTLGLHEVYGEYTCALTDFISTKLNKTGKSCSILDLNVFIMKEDLKSNILAIRLPGVTLADIHLHNGKIDSINLTDIACKFLNENIENQLNNQFVGSDFKIQNEDVFGYGIR